MREYGQIQCSFWQSDDALGCTDTGKLLAAYLMTGPHSNGIGCYRLPDGYVMEDLRWSSERVSEGFAELLRKGFAYRFEGVVCLPKFLFWNKVTNGNVAKARMAEFMALPKGDAKALVARALLKFCGFLTADDKRLLETVSETLSKGYAKQEPTQKGENPEPERNQELSSSLRSDSSPADAGDASGKVEKTEAGKPELKLVPAVAVSERREARLRAVTEDAVAAYNAVLGKPNGLLPAVNWPVGAKTRMKQVKRCTETASAICQRVFGSKHITREFWDSYFGQCAEDPHKSGRIGGGKDHANWAPDFAYLTREDVMASVFDKAMAA